MTDRPGLLEGVAQAFRDHGLTAALTALIGGSLALAQGAAGGLEAELRLPSTKRDRTR